MKYFIFLNLWFLIISAICFGENNSTDPASDRGQLIPSGSVMMYTGCVSAGNPKPPYTGNSCNGLPEYIPEGWMLSYGQFLSKNDLKYKKLFESIGTTYGVDPANPTTTFKIPDCRGRDIVGRDNMGSSSETGVYNSSANRLLGTYWTRYSQDTGYFPKGAYCPRGSPAFPCSDEIRKIVVDGSRIFLATSSGGLFISFNDGITWTSRRSSVFDPLSIPSDNVKDIFMSGNLAYIATDRGVAKSTDGTFTSWTTLSGVPATSISVYAIPPNNVYVGTSGNGLYVSTNGGTSWGVHHPGIWAGNDYILRIYAKVDGADTLVYAGTQNGFVMSFDNGSSFSYGSRFGIPISQAAYISGWFFYGNTVYVGLSNGLHISTSRGTNFEKTLLSGINVTDIYANSDGSEIYAASSYPSLSTYNIYRTTTLSGIVGMNSIETNWELFEYSKSLIGFSGRFVFENSRFYAASNKGLFVSIKPDESLFGLAGRNLGSELGSQKFSFTVNTTNEIFPYKPHYHGFSLNITSANTWQIPEGGGAPLPFPYHYHNVSISSSDLGASYGTHPHPFIPSAYNATHSWYGYYPNYPSLTGYTPMSCDINCSAYLKYKDCSSYTWHENRCSWDFSGNSCNDIINLVGAKPCSSNPPYNGTKASTGLGGAHKHSPVPSYTTDSQSPATHSHLVSGDIGNFSGGGADADADYWPSQHSGDLCSTFTDRSSCLGSPPCDWVNNSCEYTYIIDSGSHNHTLLNQTIVQPSIISNCIIKY